MLNLLIIPGLVVAKVKPWTLSRYFGVLIHHTHGLCDSCCVDGELVAGLRSRLAVGRLVDCDNESEDDLRLQ